MSVDELLLFVIIIIFFFNLIFFFKKVQVHCWRGRFSDRSQSCVFFRQGNGRMVSKAGRFVKEHKKQVTFLKKKNNVQANAKATRAKDGMISFVFCIVSPN